MNWRHLLAVAWLRWRILNNQWRRAGSANLVISLIATVLVVASAVPLFITSLLAGIYLIPRATPLQILLAWDVLVVGFLVFWTTGLVTELQRSEPLSLAKFQHLPVSLNSAFLINYLSSLLRLSLILFGPAMLGFAIALMAVKGARLALVLPALGAFVLMISALSYQLQGWLAGMMDNPRLRRTIVVGMTAFVVAVSQLPSLINLLAARGKVDGARVPEAQAHDMAKLDDAFRAREFSADEYVRRREALAERYRSADARSRRATLERWGRTAVVLNRVLPIGWLALGAMSAADGRLAPAVAGLLGMTLLGSASLGLAYRATVRQYQGTASSKPRPSAARPEAAGSARRGRTRLLEIRLPLVSEPVSAIALGAFRSLLRAPEAKMMLLSPLIMLPVFAAAFVRREAIAAGVARETIAHDLGRAAVAIAGGMIVLFGLIQLMGNQFGFDRDGFRVFVLSSARRRDILLGKNLAFAPLAFGMDLILLVIIQVARPLRLDHLLAMLPQFVSMFLMLCMMTNFMSIYAPLYVPAGAVRPSNVKMTTIFLQLTIFLLVFPLAQGLNFLPLGTEGLLELAGWTHRLPVGLFLALVECGVVVLLYAVSLNWLGQALQAREQRILETVTSRAI